MKEEIKEFLKTNSLGRIASNNEANAKFSQYYLAIFETEFCAGCPGKLTNAYNQLFNYVTSNNPIKMKENCDFSMRKDVVVYDNISHTHYTNANLTNEAALNLMSLNKKFIDYFETKPEGWEDMLAEHIAKLSKPKPQVKEVKQTEDPAETITEQFEKELFSSNKKKLQLICKQKEYPADEWNTFTRDELAGYILKKESEKQPA